MACCPCCGHHSRPCREAFGHALDEFCPCRWTGSSKLVQGCWHPNCHPQPCDHPVSKSSCAWSPDLVSACGLAGDNVCHNPRRAGRAAHAPASPPGTTPHPPPPSGGYLFYTVPPHWGKGQTSTSHPSLASQPFTPIGASALEFGRGGAWRWQARGEQAGKAPTASHHNLTIQGPIGGVLGTRCSP